MGDWEALARAVIDRRVELGHNSREAFAKASGISIRTLGDVESARRQSYAPETLVRLDRSLRWPSGATHGIVNGSAHFEQGKLVIQGDSKQLPAVTVRGTVWETDWRTIGDDPDSLEAKLERLRLLGQTLTPAGRRRLHAQLDVLLERLESRQEAEAAPGDRQALEQFRETLAAGEPKQRATGLDLDLRALEGLLNPDTRIDDRARAAIRQLLAAAVELGGQAMLAWDAQHGPGDEVLERAGAGRQDTDAAPRRSTSSPAGGKR